MQKPFTSAIFLASVIENCTRCTVNAIVFQPIVNFTAWTMILKAFWEVKSLQTRTRKTMSLAKNMAAARTKKSQSWNSDSSSLFCDQCLRYRVQTHDLSGGRTSLMLRLHTAILIGPISYLDACYIHTKVTKCIREKIPLYFCGRITFH